MTILDEEMLSHQAAGTLAILLNLMTVDNLKQLAVHLPVEKKITRKAEFIKLISSFLLGEQLQQLWQQLDPIQQSAVGETLYNYGGEFYPARFKAKYGNLPNFTLDKKSSYGRYEHITSVLGKLRLLMFSGDRYSNSNLKIPVDLQDKLRSFVPQPAASSLNTSDTLPESYKEHKITCRDTEQSSLQDVQTVLRLTSLGKLSASSKTALPSKATIKKLSELLINGDYYAPDALDSWGEAMQPIKGFAWPLLLQGAKLAQVNGSKLVLTNAGKKALSAPPAETIKLIWQRWLKTKLIDEFSRINEIKGQKRKSRNTMTPVTDRRPVISDALSHCTVGQWIKLDEFSSFMQAENYSFEVSKEPWDLYFGDPEYGSLGYDGRHDWHILQGRYLSCLLFEYAATLGLLDVAYIHPENAERDFDEFWGAEDLNYLSRYDGLLYFRITDLGAYCLGITDSYQQKKSTSKVKLSVLPNLQIKAARAISISQSQLLETYSDKISENQWRLNADKMIQAIEHGQDITELETLLSEADDQLLPEAVESLIRRVKRQANSLKIKDSTLLIECVDADTANKIAQHEHTKKLCMLAGTKHLVLTGTEQAFRKALRKLGYGMPLV